MEINLSTGEQLYSSPVGEVFAAALETVLAHGDIDTGVDVLEHRIVFAVADPATDERREFVVSVAVHDRQPPR
jgi:hypothetical protein